MNHEIISPGASPIVRANFSENLDRDAVLFTVPAKKDAPAFKLCALWNSKEVKVCVKAPCGSKLTAAIEKASKELVAAEESSVILLSLDDAGLSATDVGQLIPLTVKCELDGKETLFDGFISLADYTPVYKYSEGDLKEISKKAHVNPELDVETLDMGVVEKDSSVRFYDRYNDGKGNYMHTDVQGHLIGIGDIEGSKKVVIDADIVVDSLPPIDYSTISDSFGGYGFTFRISAGNNKDSLVVGIQRDYRGLFLYCNRGFVAIDKKIGKDFGEPFHLTLVWTRGSSLAAYIDGVLLSEIYHPVMGRKSDFSESSVKLIWSRCHHAPKSHDDDADITIDNLTFSSDTSDSSFDKITVDDLLRGAEKVMSRAADVYVAPEKLGLFDSIQNERYGTEAKILWDISDESMISNDGVVAMPENVGKTFSLTMTAVSGKYAIHQREFKFFAKAKSPRGNALVLMNDLDPFTGSLLSEDAAINLGADFTSIGYDMGETARVNRIVITSDLPIGFVNKNHISLFCSDDNKEYTYIPHYSVLKRGNKLYFYNFDVNARYIKVNTTTGSVGETNKNIRGSVLSMIDASYDTSPLLASGEFGGKTSVKVTNDTEKPLFDKIASFSPEELSICPCKLKDDMSDVRFMLDGKCLPVYFSEGRFYVRIFEIASGSSVEIDVLYSNPAAENIFDGNEVFEIQYGAKHAKNNPDRSWVNSVATLPNGDIMKVFDGPLSNGYRTLAYTRSRNGGLTWDAPVMIEGSENVSHHGGFIIDNKTGKVFYVGYYLKFAGYAQREKIDEDGLSHCEPRIFLSEDNGYTWTGPMTISGENIPIYLLSYSNGITLRDADGEGPNVDYVFSTGMMWDQNKLSFCDAFYYSKDGGKTWLLSDTTVNYAFGGDSNTFEGGMSEETIWEKEDGTLLVYARCELKHIKHFAIARSFDHGITWVAPKEDDLSNIYATNTQPIIESFNGRPVFMWGGQNAFGAKSHWRLPLSLAVSYDDAENFRDHVDASFQTLIATVDRRIIGNLHTNPDMTFCKYRGNEMLYLVSTHHQLYVLGVDDFLYKTKGAFDSFENGVEAEGWLCESGYPTVSELGATDGRYAMLLEDMTNPSRSLHHIEEGYVEFDCYVDSFGEHFSAELQTAYHDREGFAAPIRITADSEGNVFGYTAEGTDEASRASLGLKLRKGQNRIRFDFNAEAGKASVTVNGETAEMTYIGGIGDVICFITLFTTLGSKIAIDKLIAENYRQCEGAN